MVVVILLLAVLAFERLNKDPERSLPAMSLNMLAAEVERDLDCTPVPKLPVVSAVAVIAVRGMTVGENTAGSPVV